jgi:Flp pilus assembly protein TadG
MHSPFRAERGSVTAEFAVILPAVLLILVAVLAAMQVAGEQLRLQAATSDAARLFARADPRASARVADAVPGATVSIRRDAGLICADARAPTSLGMLSGLTLTASSCALDDSS